MIDAVDYKAIMELETTRFYLQTAFDGALLLELPVWKK